jgi:hypothetical protein
MSVKIASAWWVSQLPGLRLGRCEGLVREQIEGCEFPACHRHEPMLHQHKMIVGLFSTTTDDDISTIRR